MVENETVFKKLIIKSQTGDAAAYNELLSGFAVFLKNYLRKRIFEHNDIEEVLQEILMAVHKSLHTYDIDRSLMSWLMAIAEYKIVDYVRDLQKRRPHSDLDSISSLFAGINSDTDLKIDIDRALSRLHPREMTVLNLLKVEGQSVTQVAKQLNLTESNVKVIAHRAYANFRIYLGSHL